MATCPCRSSTQHGPVGTACGGSPGCSISNTDSTLAFRRSGTGVTKKACSFPDRGGRKALGLRLFVRSSRVLCCGFAVAVGSSRVFFGLCSLAMCMKVRGLQVMMRCSHMVCCCLVMMIDGRMGCLCSHERFPFLK